MPAPTTVSVVPLIVHTEVESCLKVIAPEPEPPEVVSAMVLCGLA